MKQKHHPSIKGKLNIIILTSSMIALLISCSVFIGFDRSSYKDNLVKHSNMLAKIIGTNCSAAILFNNTEDANEILSALSSESTVLLARLYTADGRLFTEYSKPGLTDSTQLQPLHINQYNAVFHQNFMQITERVMIGQEQIAVIVILFSLDEMQARTNTYISVIFIVLLACFIVVISINHRLQRMITRPIMQLTDIVDKVSKTKDYTIRAKRISYDETGFLVVRFNEMLEEISSRDYELEQAKNQLELRVEERTRELENSKSDLEKRYEELEFADNQIKASLREKEVLLKEIHHRVKNNLQVISSLLSLQSNQIDDEYALAMFKESQDRVRSMAIVHQKLYQSEDFSSIDFGDYINSLAMELYRSYTVAAGRIQITKIEKTIQLPINLAVPCGLIVNELISNALKHAFPPEHRGKKKIDIQLLTRKEDLLELTIADNGIGLPENIDYRNLDSLGFKLVVILVEDQLQGNIDWFHENGTKFVIRFNPQQ